MTQTGYANAVVNALLGWLRGLANWVLKLFNLAGGTSPLTFLAKNWKGILIVLLIVGVAADLLVWLIRWRPHWVWLGKKRVVINDKDFFKNESKVRHDNTRPKRNWEDSEFVVRSSYNRRSPQKRPTAQTAQTQGDVFSNQKFNVNAKQRFSDKYEDEVFNVSDLPDRRGEKR